MIVATAHYFAIREIKASGLVPLSCSVGSPKTLPYELGGAVRPATPFGIFGVVEDADEYRRLYRQRLDSFGPSSRRSVQRPVPRGRDLGRRGAARQPGGRVDRAIVLG